MILSPLLKPILLPLITVTAVLAAPLPGAKDAAHISIEGQDARHSTASPRPAIVFSSSSSYPAFVSSFRSALSSWRNSREEEECGEPSSSVFLEAANGTEAHSTFYTTAVSELPTGYSTIGPIARIFPTRMPQTAPLYRFFRIKPSGEHNYFYTARDDELIVIELDGYVREDVAGYNTDHRLVTSSTETDTDEYMFDGLVAYVLPLPDSDP